MPSSDLTATQFDVLRSAVTLAKSHQTRKVETLRKHLKIHGYLDADIDAALSFWAAYARASDEDA